ncbi:MAG: hypothetical protein V5A27_05635 [Halapricum sp.]
MRRRKYLKIMGSGVASGRSDTDSYSEYIYAPEVPDSDVKFRIYTKTLASAIGWSATSISTATAGYGNDYVDLDKWEIQDYH